MSLIFPAGIEKVRNLTERFRYFMVVKPATRLLSNLPLIEYFIYKFIVPVSEDRGISDITKHYINEEITEIKALNDIEYNTGNFSHPRYTNQDESALKIPFISLHTYTQKDISNIEIKGSIPKISRK